LKILIVTYTYPPAKSVNGFRPYHFAKALNHAGWEVAVLTRHFTGNEQIPEDYSRPNRTPFSIDRQPEAIIYRTPFFNSWFAYHQIGWIRHSGLWKLIYFIQLLSGRTTQESYNKYFKIYLPALLKQQAYDIILVESGPTNLVRLVSKYALKYKIKYAIDFRDAYYHDMYQDFNTLNWNKKIKVRLEERYTLKAIKRANRVFSLSYQWLDILKVPPHLRVVVNNGFDEEEWQKIIKHLPRDQFVISSVGTLYHKPFLDVLLKSIDIFFNKGFKNVRVHFLAPGNEEVIARIKQLLPYDSIHIDPERKTYTEAIQCMADSQVLIYHGWKGWLELAGSKIFDYLRSGNKILIVPSDKGPMEKWINQTRSGIITDSPEQAAHALELWYTEWKTTGKLESASDLSTLEQYSREHQSKILEQSLRTAIQNG